MTGLLVPKAKQQFTDASGVPLAGGFVYHYIYPATTTPKLTWSDPALTVPNANPIVLDAGGYNPAGGIWGELGGIWRQVVTDRLGNLVWDLPTANAPGAGSSGSLYDIPFFFQGTLTDGEQFPIFNVVRAFTMPVGLLLSRFSIKTAPTADLPISILKNVTTVGTVTFHTDLSNTVSFLAQVTFNPGDQVVIQGPNPHDSTGGGIAGTIVTTTL